MCEDGGDLAMCLILEHHRESWPAQQRMISAPVGHGAMPSRGLRASPLHPAGRPEPRQWSHFSLPPEGQDRVQRKSGESLEPDCPGSSACCGARRFWVQVGHLRPRLLLCPADVALSPSWSCGGHQMGQMCSPRCVVGTVTAARVMMGG